VTKQLDQLGGGLIFELNKLHSAGQGLQGVSTVTAQNAVKDTGAALNTSDAGLAFAPSNGSFVVHVKQKGTGLTTITLVQVNLDGLNGDDTTLDSLKSDIDAISGVSASITGGKLAIKADSNDVEISFSQDSSGVLASLGINSFFSGSDASNIAIADSIRNNPSLLAAAKNGQPGDNQTATDIADLESQVIGSLGGATLKDSYDSMINGIAVSAATAKTSADAASAVQDTLSTQREALSGVSLDEEAINLIREQRAFQGAARVISAVDEMMKTLLAL